MGCKKQGAKNKVIAIQKDAAALFSFGIIMTMYVFCTLLFASHIFDLIFFQGHKPTHLFKTKVVGAD